MLNLTKCFNEFLPNNLSFLQRRHVIAEDISDYVDDGKIELYYIGPDEDKETLVQPGPEPEDFAIRSARAEMPRVFLYLDPNERKRDVGMSVYEVEVLAEEIYNIPVDPDNLVRAWRGASKSVDDLYNSIMAAGYKGHYTSGRGFDCVEWYYPLAAKKAVLFT